MHIVATEFDSFPKLGAFQQESKASCVATGHTLLPVDGILPLCGAENAVNNTKRQEGGRVSKIK